MSIKAKFPDDVLDYGFDWTAFLASEDTIASATITTVPNDMTAGSTIINDGIVTAVLSGGALGKYTVLCEINTVGGLTAFSAQQLTVSNTAR